MSTATRSTHHGATEKQRSYVGWYIERIEDTLSSRYMERIEDILSNPITIITIFVLLAAIQGDSWYLLYAGQVAILTGLATILGGWFTYLKEKRRRRRLKKGRRSKGRLKLEISCLALGLLFPPAVPFVAQIYVFSWLATHVFGWVLHQSSAADTADELLLSRTRITTTTKGS